MNTQSLTKVPTPTEEIFHLGIKAIIHNTDGNILILKLHKDTKQYWDIPGGRVQVGESHEQTLLREIHEETGINHLHTIRHVGMTTSSIRIPLGNQQSAGLIFSLYTATVQDTHISLSVEYGWMSPKDTIRLLEPVYGPMFKWCVTISCI